MNTITTTQLKQSLGSCMQSLPQGAIKITRRNRNYAYLVPAEEYEDLKSLEIYEDLLMGAMAKTALQSGTIGTKAAAALFDSDVPCN